MKLSNQEYIKQLDFLEQKNGLYNVLIDSIPIWRLLRFEYRIKYLKSKTGFTNKTFYLKKKWFEILKNLVLSIIELLKVSLSRKRNTILFFAFPRLSHKDGIYYDKFTDPIIKYIEDKRDVVVLQRSLGGSYFEPRMNSDLISKSDSILYVARITSILFLPFTILLNFLKFKNLKNNVNKIYVVSPLFYIKTAFVYGNYYFTKCIYKVIYRLLDVNQIFLVNRDVFAAQIVAGKELSIPVYELQHGATPAESALYTGPYNATVDPDLFLCFGKIWVGEQFGLPLPQVKNIGWALKDSQNLYKGVVENHKRLLFISYPAITSKIISVLKTLSLNNTYYTYVLRLHPQEALSDSQQKDLEALPNVKVEHYTKNVQQSILESKIVFGDKSTVLYEALSLGKTVRQINFGELKRDHSSLEESLFKPLDTLDDFFISLEDKDEKITHSNDIYSNFDSSLMNDILNI